MTILAGNKEDYKFVVTLLKNINKWDAAFHDLHGETFELIQYNLHNRLNQ